MAAFTKRSSGKWRAKIRRRGYPDVSKTLPTKAMAERWARSIETEMDSSAFVSRIEAEKTTLKEALSRYLNEVTPKKKGANSETARIKAWMKHDLAERYLSNLKSTDFAKFRDSQLESNLAASTIRNKLNIISHLVHHSSEGMGHGEPVKPH